MLLPKLKVVVVTVILSCGIIIFKIHSRLLSCTMFEFSMASLIFLEA
jgi:hypothetical protein